MAITRIKNDIFMHKAAHLYFTPWVYDTENKKWKPGTNTYDIADIVADTLSIEQADPSTETRDWEFGDTPLMTTTTQGEITFAATCIDMSLQVMEKVFGWKVSSDTTKPLVYAPDTYADIYGTIVVTFEDQNTPVVILPKVLMSSKATIGTLRTSTGEAALSGTAMSAALVYGSTMSAVSTPYAFATPINNATISVCNSTTDSMVTIGIVRKEVNRETYLIGAETDPTISILTANKVENENKIIATADVTNPGSGTINHYGFVCGTSSSPKVGDAGVVEIEATRTEGSTNFEGTSDTLELTGTVYVVAYVTTTHGSIVYGAGQLTVDLS